jgi:predicted DNA-binding transcriptional regulator YafY
VGNRARPGNIDEKTSLRLAVIVHRLLADPRGLSTRSLRDELGIADRTVRKYQGLLRDHFPPFRGRLVVERREGGTWLCLRDRSLPVDACEVVARLTAQRFAADLLAFVGPEQGVRRAATDARDALLKDVRRSPFGVLQRLLPNLDRILHVQPDAPKDYSAKGRELGTILQALTFSRRLAFDHTHPGGAPRRHEVEPLTLGLWRSGLYLVVRYAEGKKKSDPYQFAVDRMTNVELLDDHYAYPSVREYTPAAFMSGAFGVFVPRRDRRKTILVDLRFEPVPWIQTFVRERRWAPDQKVVDERDGRMRLTFVVASLAEVGPWVRQWGTACRVLGPPELASAVQLDAPVDARPPGRASSPSKPGKPSGKRRRG